MTEPSWTLRLSLEGPFGERYQVAMGVDAFTARDQLVDLSPPSAFDIEFGAISFNAVVTRIKKREIRHEILQAECVRLGEKLAQTMQDAEGWHDASRIEPNKRILAGLDPAPMTNRQSLNALKCEAPELSDATDEFVKP